MRRFSLVEFSVDHPRLVVSLLAVVTVFFLAQFPKIQPDTNPKNMLPPTSDVRVWNDQMEKTFGLYEDMIVLGIVNEKGVLNSSTLGKIRRISDEILRIEGVAARDVSSFTTIDDMTTENGILKVAPLMTAAPEDAEGIEKLRKSLYENPLFLNRIISNDGKAAAIYIPVEKGANGKAIADQLREILAKEKGEEKYYIVGDPVVRDIFGSAMFKLMAVFAPIAGLVMFIVRYLMFRDLFLSVALMMDAMISIVWSMGLAIGLGFPIHLMSSMAPVFLMAIATDSIHIFNEFYFSFKEMKNKKKAILATMQSVSRPVRNTALATAVGFAVLLFMESIPLKVFGGIVAFGTVILRVLSFSFIPAMFTFLKEEKIGKIAVNEDITQSRTSRILMKMAGIGVRRPGTVVLVGLVLVAIAFVGISDIVVNNNMVAWFKKNSEVRTADRVINSALEGTSQGYIVAIAPEDEYIKTPEAMRYIEGLQRHIEKLDVVGKTISVADYVKRINRVLHDNNPRYEVVPDEKTIIGQYLFLFSMSAKPSDIDNVVDYSFRQANIWVKLKTWDSSAMQDVISAVEEYKMSNPTPMALKPAGIAYFNLIWNHFVLWDIVKGFIVALIAVLCILAFDFRSFKWAVVGYVPLMFTIFIVYGALGFMGKDVDMPVAVLSCLSLGMAVDFAIHFVNRLMQRLDETQGRESLADALLWTAARPGKGIVRNAVLFAASFFAMIFSPLVPYITVGAFLVSMMLLSAVTAIIYLPALVTLLRGWLFRGETYMKTVATTSGVLALVLLASGASAAENNGADIMRKSQAAFLYAGRDFKARVVMKLMSAGGQERLRKMTMVRKNLGETGGDQNYFMFFHRPADVKDMTFMVQKHPGRDADRWLFIPAINMVRRIAARDKRSSFVGSDFSYEDVSGRDLEDDIHAVMREENVGEKACIVVKSTPKEADVEYSYKLSWIDTSIFLPLKEEYYDKKGDLYKIFTADEIKSVKDIPTVTKRTMKNILSGHRTEATLTNVDYNIGVDDSLFTERYLRQPPMRWIQ